MMSNINANANANTNANANDVHTLNANARKVSKEVLQVKSPLLSNSGNECTQWSRLHRHFVNFNAPWTNTSLFYLIFFVHFIVRTLEL